MKRPTKRRAFLPSAVCVSIFTLGFAARGETGPDSALQTKTPRGVLLGLDIVGIAGGSGMLVSFDSLAVTGKTAAFQDTVGLRLGRKPWMLGLDVGFLAVSPDVSDHATGVACSARSDGFQWAMEVRRVF